MELTQVRFTLDSDVIDQFTNGQCNALAYRLHLLTGWTLAMLSDEPVGSDDYMAHVFVIDSDANAIDIEGKRSLSAMQYTWSFLPLLYRFNNLKEFETEMTLWDNSVHYTIDKEAKIWAKKIVDML